LSGDIQAVSGATVHVHEADALLVEGDDDAWAENHNRHEQLFEEWGMPEEKQAVLREKMAATRSERATPDVTPFEDDETFAVNDTAFRVVHAPGHAAGLCLFEFENAGSLDIFSGDVLLPVYTPNVGGADVRLDDPLGKYLQTLRDLADAQYNRAWPGHRSPIDNPTERATHIIHHHEERAWLILDTLRQSAPLDTWSISDVLFGKLNGVHIIHGPGECHAHLRHLLDAGTVVVKDGEYSLAEGIAERVNRSEDECWPLE
jgi:glyoxylase-like metal-dependent hydrolase (beta-lactamase superfamily II)